MAKGSTTPTSLQTQSLGADVVQLIEQLERHCLAPDGSYVSKTAHSDLQLAREEMWRERTRYLEAMAIYLEAIAMVEEYQQSLYGTNMPNARESLHSHPDLMSSSQVYESLDHRLIVAEAAQRLRLPLLSKDGDIHEEEIEKWSVMSRSSFDSTTTSFTVNSSSNSVSYNNSVSSKPSRIGVFPSIAPSGTSDVAEPGVGGVPNKFLGITPSFLWKAQKKPQTSTAVDMTEYQRSIACEIESRLEDKCEKLADAFSLHDSDSISHISSSRLAERVKFFIEDIEQEEAILLEDLYSMDRKFAEHYNVLEQILIVLIKFVKELKLQDQHQYDELRKTWLCKRCQTMNAKLRVLEHLLLRDTYTKDSVPALHIIRKCLLEATEEASIGYNKAVTRLREYQGVDPHFDTIARQYHDIVKKLEGMQWTIHQVEMDLKRSMEHASASSFG